MCTLWRSRVASEALALVPDASQALAHADEATGVDSTTDKGEVDGLDGIEFTSTGDDGNGSGDGASNGHVLQPTLSIVFEDNYVMRVTQRAMVRQMVKMGMGAPSGNNDSLFE